MRARPGLLPPAVPGPLPAWKLAVMLEAVNRSSRRTLLVGAAMALVVAAVAGLASWDGTRESEAALRDLADAQVRVAESLAIALEAIRPSPLPPDPRVLHLLSRVEERGSSRVLLYVPADKLLHTTSGESLRSARLLRALGAHERGARIPRDEASALGLPARTAMAGIAYPDREAGAAIVVITSAERQRDREEWARHRLVLSVVSAAGMVLIFGGLLRRAQTKELLLERELAVAEVQRQGDERLERASRVAALGTLAVGVAHEISTPLGIISARAEQIEGKVSGDPRLAGAAAAIISQADRIKQVIRGLLGLARGDSPASERVDPRTIVSQAVALVQHRLEAAGIPLSESIDAALPPVVGDPRLLEHAVVNLLLNACDACRGNGGDVTVTAIADEAQVTIAVEDTGSGISEADRERALEPFFTTKSREGGSGMGLAIAREIVASHRGTLVLGAAAPRGTRALIRLPVAAGARDAC